MKQCTNCNEEFDDRGSVCTKCRVKLSRERKKGAAVDGARPEPPKEFTEVDKLFDEYRPDYYTFGSKLYKNHCHLVELNDKLCKQEFESHLQLLKFCSPDHQRAAIYIMGGNAEKAKELI